jgi:glycosyltransferase involved in cell wall biosynthesis
VTVRPVVSVCMPSYNYGRFLPEAIESVLDQSYEDFELLLIDNGSDDGSYEIALGYADRDPRIRVLIHADRENRGVNASLNLGLAEAVGTYFGLLPADDVYLRGSLERRVALLEREPAAAFVYGGAQVIDEAGRPTGQVGGRAPDAVLGFDRTGDLLQALLFHDFVPGAALLTRRELLTQIGGFDEAVYFNDWYATIRLLARAGCVFVVGEPVVGYRHHERHRSVENLAADRPRKIELFRSLWDISGTADDRLREPRLRALIALQRAFHAYRLGEVAEARAAVADAFAVDPLLREDDGYLAWWLNPCHGEWSLGLDREARRRFLRVFASPLTPAEAVLDEGSEYTRFARFLLQAGGDAIAPGAAVRFAWRVLADQLEAIAHGPLPTVFASSLLRAAVHPGVLRLRPFAKIVLSAGGVWGLATRARRRAASLARQLPSPR